MEKTAQDPASSEPRVPDLRETIPHDEPEQNEVDHLDSPWYRTNGAERKVRDLFVWTSLSHPERNYPKGAFTTIATIALLLSIIFAFFQEWFLIGLAWATVFLLFALSKVIPSEVEHRITTQGIISMGHTYLWADLGAFWFSDKGGHRMLHIGYRNVFGQLVFLINKADEERIRDELAQFVPFIEVWQKSTIEKLTDWATKRFPLEKILASKSASHSEAEPLAQEVSKPSQQTDEGMEKPATIESSASLGKPDSSLAPTVVSPPPSSEVASS